MLESDHKALIGMLIILEKEHTELNMLLDSIPSPKLDDITRQRLKKRRLWLKDEIIKLKSLIYPDIIA